MTRPFPLPDGIQTGRIAKGPFPSLAEGERVDTLMAAPSFRIERILSSGHATAPGVWYDQSGDEWVLLLEGQATIAFENGTRFPLEGGEWMFLPAHVRHRVESTSSRPGCVWLAVHLTRAE